MFNVDYDKDEDKQTYINAYGCRLICGGSVV